MRLAMPFVWDERCLAHDPRSEVWVGVATPAAETSSRIEAIRAALLEAQAPQVASVPHDDDALLAVHDPELVAYLGTAWDEWRRMQIVYQDPYESLDPRLRVRATVEEPLSIHGLGGSRAERAERVRAALARVELSPPELLLERFPHELSGGQRQRVAIAAGLVLEPSLLVADEPVSMLDVSVRAGVLRLLDGLRENGLGILMITHDLSTAARFADRIAVMYLGRIVEEGPAREVVHNAQHPYTKALLSVVPRRDPRDRTRPQILTGETPDAVRIPSGCRFHPRCPVAIDECSLRDPALERPHDAHTPDHRAACILA